MGRRHTRDEPRRTAGVGEVADRDFADRGSGKGAPHAPPGERPPQLGRVRPTEAGDALPGNDPSGGASLGFGWQRGCIL